MVDEQKVRSCKKKISALLFYVISPYNKMASGNITHSASLRSQPKSTKPKVDQKSANIRKRQPRRLPKRKNDIYVTRKSNMASQLEQCQKLLDGGESEIHIHGLGAAISRALNIALQLESRGLGTLQVAVSTASVDLVDDIEPLCDEGDFDTRERTNSAVHIRLFRTVSKKNDGAHA